MKRSIAKLLQVPSGSTPLLHREAMVHGRLVRDLQALFSSWAYTPVHAPLLDYSSPYHGLISDHDQDHIYHLVGRDGAILMLRWDNTLFLVKQLAGTLRDSKETYRFSYADAILRHQEDLDIGRNENFQAGVELIGPAGPDGDLEVLTLLSQAIKTMGLPKTAIHVGSRAIFEEVFKGLDIGVQESLADSIKLRDWEAFAKLAIQGLDPQEAEAAQRLFSTIRPAGVGLQDLARGLSSQVALRLKELETILNTLVKIIPDLDYRFDASELGSQGYHSGIVFQAYTPGLDSAFAAGGRYDKLLERLGSPRPAVGFSIMVSKVERLVLTTGLLEDQSDPPVYLRAEDGNFELRFARAQELRAQGRKVAL